MQTTKQLLAIRLKQIRKSRGLTQEKLAELIGRDTKHISKLEIAGSYPSIETLERIAAALNVELKDIFNFDDDKLAIFRRRQVGIIYQFYNLIPILNVEENITLPCDLDGNKVDEKRLNELLKSLGLENRRKHLPNELSGGQQQRVSIGRALINNPAIILADEPTGNLDSKASEEIVELLKLTNKKYKQTIIMITHNLEIANEADRVLKIEDGKIVKEK